MTMRVILTVVGSDRPGLTQALADAVLAAGGNWLESHLARLGGKYVGSVLVELAPERHAALEESARSIDGSGLSVTVIAAAGDAATLGQPLRLDLVGQDRPGIVREVTTALAGLGVNIEAFESRIEEGAESGVRLFRVEAELMLPETLAADQVRDALELISGEIMVDFSVSAPA